MAIANGHKYTIFKGDLERHGKRKPSKDQAFGPYTRSLTYDKGCDTFRIYTNLWAMVNGVLDWSRAQKGKVGRSSTKRSGVKSCGWMEGNGCEERRYL